MAGNPNASYIGHYAKENTSIPGVYNGMRMEVLDEESGELLFGGSVQVQNEHLIEVFRTSELLRADIAEGLPVSVRGFNAYQNCGILISGRLSKLAQNQDKTWLVRQVDLKGRDTGRSFSRRPIRAEGWVRPLAEREERWIPCKVVNASSGGVCFRVPERFGPEDKLSIRFRLRRGKEQPPLNIAIRRITELGDMFEYGTEFVDLDSEVDMVIIRTIITLQNMQ
ncbi:MAG: PilZ domain-containing protein [Oscillospiraceae bacterium]|nr:PilZ domain-containing protein [Oscillospiraceae bacterium]